MTTKRTAYLATVLLVGALAPAATAASTAQPRSKQPTAIERLIRQEDARRHDLRLGITRATPAITAPAPAAPRIEVVTRGGFDWLDAAFGALAAVVAVAGVALAALLVLDRQPRHA